MEMMKVRISILMVMMMMVMMSEGNIIEQTCKQTPDFNLCVSLLKSDPRASTADISGLALILVDKIKELATKTLNEINSEYKQRPDLKPALDKCSDAYKTVLNYNVDEAISAITSGDPKFAETAVSDTNLEASTCEEKIKGKTPLSSLNQSMQKICSVTRAIVRMLL